MEIQITKKEREEYGGKIVSPSGSDLLPKETDIVEYTRAEKIKLGLLETGITCNCNDLNGTNYVMVYGVGTPTKNAAELQAAYDEAKNMPRYIGAFENYISTFTGILAVGSTFECYDTNEPLLKYYYKVTVATSVVSGSEIPSNDLEWYVQITPEIAKSVRTTVIVAPGEYNFGTSAFVVDAQSIDIVSLTGNSDVIISSTEVNSVYNYTYGIKVHAENILIKGINCKTNTFFIESYVDDLICEYCIGGSHSFGGHYSTVVGTFNHCIAGDNSFGGNSGFAEGTFNNCIAGDSSFGGYGTASGIFNNCIAGVNSFACYGGTASGTFNHCIGGNNSFGKYGTISAAARLYYTRLTSGTFQTPAGGRLILCIDGDNNIITI